MTPAQEKLLEKEIAHILSSGVNKFRLMEMLKPFIEGCELVAYRAGRNEGAMDACNDIMSKL